MYNKKYREEPLTREEKAIRKHNKMLHNICKECGRERKIPTSFCRDCWTMLQSEIKN